MMRAIMNVRKTIAEGAADTPVLRLVALLERVASRHEPFALQGLVEDTGLPKPTLHRMLQQLEGAGLLRRESDGRRYGTGVRLRQLAENLLLNDTLHGARHAVLRQLVEEVGESCNLTALSGSDVIYLDRVETAAPLRFYLHPGSRVPVHCSASGKMFLAQMSPLQRKRLLAHAPLQPYTASTITVLSRLENEIVQVRRNGYALDNEEFLPGLVCLAVPVPTLKDDARSRANLCVALQAPAMRLSAEKALKWLPALRRAALAFSRIDTVPAKLAKTARPGKAEKATKAAPQAAPKAKDAR
jgi:DNA-binding IclR family transcriptional regulator